MDLKKEIERLVEEIIREKDLYLVDVKIPNGPKTNKVSVLVDGDQDVSIDTIGEINQALSNKLDEVGVMNSQYTLEVSSPGIDYPLTLLRQYKKNIGRQVKVLLRDNLTKKGELLNVDDSGITIKEEKNKSKGRKSSFEEIQLPFSDIKKTNVIASFK